MKSIRRIAAAAVAVLSFSISARADLKVVDHVDLNKYIGDWYQIAHIPLWFEGDIDCACTRQRLGTTDKPGVVSVLNTCTKKDGALYSIAGSARLVDTQTNAKFAVTLAGVPFEGSYWIIGLDEQYRFAVVSDRYSLSLYILSKTPTLEKTLYDQAVEIARMQKLDISKLKVTKQNGCTYPK